MDSIYLKSYKDFEKLEFNSSLIDKNFQKKCEDFLIYVDELKSKIDKYDQKDISENLKIKFIEKLKVEAFIKFDKFFDLVWKAYCNIKEEDRINFLNYFYFNLVNYFGKDIEINSHIRAQPLGYAGDFYTMNYIYEYNEKKYLGKNLYEKLINNYTCNIDVSRSNIARKNFIKLNILNTIKKKNPRVLSVGSGPTREIFELYIEEKIFNTVDFNFIDFEEKAIDYSKKVLSPFLNGSNRHNYYKMNLLNLVKNRNLRDTFDSFDLIYVSGVFDYLSNRLCKSLTKELVKLLRNDAKLIIANMSLKNAKHRAYYELFGNWKMIHRNKSDMIRWVEDMKNINYKIITVNDCPSYFFLNINKK